jgi:hypothetical protein
MPFKPSIFHRPFFIRLLNWEYWSFNAIYFWVFPAWAWFCLRARSLYFFNASNPSIENGGLLNESKKDIHALLPEHLYPRSLHFACGTDPSQVWQALLADGFKLPLMGKPDVGGRGRGVKKLNSEREVREYASGAVMDYHFQEYVPYPLEAGIFYYRYPDSESGKISGIVTKEFLSVTGNGRDTIRDLLFQDKRGIMYLSAMEGTLGPDISLVLPAGDIKVVSPYGNHARGSLFVDDSHLADARLTDAIDRLARQIPGFYFGRFDIRFKDWDSLRNGQDFLLIEVNGAGAEPTHMYDPRHSLFFAWKEIVRHWHIMNKISRMNHKRGIRYLGCREGREVFKKDRVYARLLEKMPR